MTKQTITTKISKTDDEYRVKLYVNGVHDEAVDYFTDDRDDAKETALHMKKHYVPDTGSSPRLPKIEKRYAFPVALGTTYHETAEDALQELVRRLGVFPALKAISAMMWEASLKEADSGSDTKAAGALGWLAMDIDALEKNTDVAEAVTAYLAEQA